MQRTSDRASPSDPLPVTRVCVNSLPTVSTLFPSPCPFLSDPSPCQGEGKRAWRARVRVIVSRARRAHVACAIPRAAYLGATWRKAGNASILAKLASWISHPHRANAYDGAARGNGSGAFSLGAIARAAVVRRELPPFSLAFPRSLALNREGRPSVRRYFPPHRWLWKPNPEFPTRR